MQDKNNGRRPSLKEVDVKLQKMNAERKERRGLENRLRKLTNGIPLSAKITFNF